MTAQKKDTEEWTSAAALTIASVPVTPGRSMAPAARVASRGSAPVANACSVDGKPLKTVDTSQA